eukprot:Rmarinus@m.16720
MLGIKHVALILLVIQNSAVIILMRYSRSLPGERYYTTTAVVMQELLKIFLSFGLLWKECDYNFDAAKRMLSTQIVDQPVTNFKMMIPSALYTVQNNMLLVGVSHLEAAVFHVTTQTKMFMAAVVSVFMLNKRLAAVQWFSLLVLMAGIVGVQYNEFSHGHDSSTTSHEQNQLTGITATLFGAFCTSFAGVYMEKQLKDAKASMWVRNIQLGIGGTLFGLFGVLSSDYEGVVTNGFFHAYDFWTWSVIIMNGLGGLIIAAVLKHADNILKGFATGFAIVVSSFASVWIFGFVVTAPFAIGTLLVVASIGMYSYLPMWMASGPPPRIRVAPRDSDNE